MAQIDIKNCRLYIRDGGSNEVEVLIGEGNITFTERKNIEYKLNRGKLLGATIRAGDEVPIDVRFEFTYIYYTGSGSGATLADALKRTGGCANWESTDDDPCQPYCVDLAVIYNPDCETGDSEEIVFNNFRYEELSYDYRAGTVSCSGKCISITATNLGTQTNTA